MLCEWQDNFCLISKVFFFPLVKDRKGDVNVVYGQVLDCKMLQGLKPGLFVFFLGDMVAYTSMSFMFINRRKAVMVMVCIFRRDVGWAGIFLRML